MGALVAGLSDRPALPRRSLGPRHAYRSRGSLRADRPSRARLALGSCRSPWPHWALWPGVSPDSLRSLRAGVALDAARSDESLRTGWALRSQRSWRPAWRSVNAVGAVGAIGAGRSLRSLAPLRTLRAWRTWIARFSLRSWGAYWPSWVPLRAGRPLLAVGAVGAVSAVSAVRSLRSLDALRSLRACGAWGSRGADGSLRSCVALRALVAWRSYVPRAGGGEERPYYQQDGESRMSLDETAHVQCALSKASHVGSSSRVEIHDGLAVLRFYTKLPVAEERPRPSARGPFGAIFLPEPLRRRRSPGAAGSCVRSGLLPHGGKD